MAGNCKTSANYIDAIINLEENVQSILMEIMVKYVQKEYPTQAVPDTEIIENLNAQLTLKENERLSILNQMKKVEQEKSEIFASFNQIQEMNKKLENENKQISQELEEFRRKSVLGENTKNIEKEKSLEAEIENLTQELEIANKKLINNENSKNDEISKIKEELFVANQKIKKIAATEQLLDQQKKKYEELMSENQGLNEELKKISILESRISELEKDKKLLEDKNVSLINELYAEKPTIMKTEGELNKALSDISKLEKDLKKAEEKSKQWELKYSTASNEIENLKKEFDELKITAGAGNLLSQEKESNYQNEISKLKNQIERLTEGSGETLKSYVLELEEKLKVLTNEKEKNQQEIILLNKHQINMEKENDSMKIKIEYYTKLHENEADQVKEYENLKHERENLLLKIKETEEKIKESEEQKSENEKLRKECEIMKNELEKLIKEKEISQNEQKTLRDTNLELEKRFARDEEKISLLEEERKRLDLIIKDLNKKIEDEQNLKLDDELTKLKISLKEKYKNKTKEMKENLISKEKLLVQKEEELQKTIEKNAEFERKAKLELENAIKEIREKCEIDKENARKSIREITENSKREERLLASALYEMGSIINQMIKEKKKDSPLNSAQVLLGKLADDRRKGGDSGTGFIASQTNMRAQSNTKKM